MLASRGADRAERKNLSNLLAPLCILPHPNRKFLFAYFTCRQAQHGLNCIYLICNQLAPIDREKKTDRMEGRSLVAIDEWMIFRDPESVGCSKLAQVRLRSV